MSGAAYLTPSSKLAGQKRRGVPALLAFMLAFLVGLLSLGSGIAVKQQEAEAGPIEWIVCEFAGENSLPRFAYEVAFTDNVAYMFNSKSAISAGTDDVAGGLNTLLGLTHDFTKTNETIMGTGLNPTSKFEGEPNAGKKVNPYDRFGMAGLYWSSYGGEWNYLKVDVCSGGEPVNMRVGAYYEERLAPVSTYGGISQSTDVRSLTAANKNIVLAYDWVNIVANGVFNITKTVVTLTNALIGLAFTDVLGAVGITDLVSSEDGLFNKLYNGVYIPLILIVMLAMAVWAGWNGIVKRAYRRTLGGILKSVVLFILAAVVALQPLFFIALPNNIAVVGQSLVVNALSTGLYSGDGLCAVGGTYVLNAQGKYVPAKADSEGLIQVDAKGPKKATDVEESENILEQASRSMQSIIGCQLWYTYVLKPWASGQYGTDFNNLWAKGFADKKVSTDPKELKNQNEAWVGDADVPLGGGYVLHNWALFQISTQTNAHVTLGTEEPIRATYTDGVANDWWRIVDAVSNYNETTQQSGIPSGNECQTGTPIDDTGHCSTYDSSDTTPVETAIPDPSKKPTDSWQSWTGAKPVDRLFTAVASVIPAIFGNIAPLLFAGMAAIFAISVAVAMIFAPIFLLLGSWPGRGWEAFKEWGQLVLNLTLKRIIAGFLLVFSLILISLLLELLRDNWFVSLIVIIIVSQAIWKLRSRIFEAVAGMFTFNFAAGRFRDTTTESLGKIGNQAKSVGAFAGRATTAAALGASVASQTGTSKRKGVINGIREELKNSAFRNPTMAAAMSEARSYMKDDLDDPEEIVSQDELCAYCGKPLWRPGQDKKYFNGGKDQDQNWVCINCMNNPKDTASGLNPEDFGAKRVTRKYETDEDKTRYSTLDLEKGDAEKNRRETVSKFTVADSKIDDDLGDLTSMKFRNAQTGAEGEDLSLVLASLFKKEYDHFLETNEVPRVPERLKPHMNSESLKVMEELWKDRNPQAKETLVLAYSDALVRYSYSLEGIDRGDIAGDVRKGTQGDIRAVFGAIVLSLNDQNFEDDADS